MMIGLQEQTRRHYDEFPFIEGGPNRIAWWKAYLRDFLPDTAIADRLVIDVGSGVGEIGRGLSDRGARLACLDISLASLRRCQEINPEAAIVHGTALDLPFADGSFAHAISIGVLHHTPDCRRGFREVARVTAPGGTVVVFLYNYWSIYHPIYLAFAPVRWLLPLEKIPRWCVKTMQPFVRWHLGQTLDDRQLRNLLGDKLWTPRASFHSVRQVRRWADEDGLDFVGRKRFFLGYANVMAFRKRGAPAPDGLRQPVFRCVKCGHTPMKAEQDGYQCSKCQCVYARDGGIVLTPV